MIAYQQKPLDLGHEIVVDLFAGGGGASLGIEWALGRGPDVAVNHDAHAIAMHEANHPETVHYCESVFDVDPLKATGGQPVGLLWASPDCTHHSKAKGGKPVSKKIRGLAWVVCEWAEKVAPRCISLENVEEFQDWGPLDDNDRPDKARRGETFREWIAELEALGYEVQHRILRACDYGAPTIRRRLFVVARRDGRPIKWPEATHGEPSDPLVRKGRRQPWRTAAECIDWSIPCPSIFTRKKPLAEATQRRIARGVQRFVLDAAHPFLVPLTHHGADRAYDTDEPVVTVTAANRGELALAAPYFIPRHGEREGQDPRTRSTQEPMPTVTGTGNGASLVSAFIAKHFGGNYEGAGSDLRDPAGTVTAKDHNALVATHITKFRSNAVGAPSEEPLPTVTANSFQKRPGGAVPLGQVAAFLAPYYGSGSGTTGRDARDPAPTVTSNDRFQVVTVDIEGQQYVLTDIGMRMLAPRELFRANGFPDSYQIDTGPDGTPLTKTAQVRLVGNSVPPQWAHALVAANFQHEREVSAA